MRYLSMLGNPRTHLRNIVGNAGFVIPREIKDAIGTGLEKLAQKTGAIKQGERTKTFINYGKKEDRELISFARNDFNENSDIIRGTTYRWDDNTARPHESRHFGKEGKGVPVKIKGKTYYMSAGNMLEVLRKANGNALDLEDVLFMRPAYAKQMAMYMKANGLKPADMVDDTLQRAQEVATNEALRATYRDMCELATWLSRAKKIDPNASKLRKLGAIAIEGLVPFAKTPVNILRRSIEYSPVGLLQGFGKIVKASKAKDGVAMAQAIDRLAAGMTGTGIVGLGYMLAKSGILTTEIGKDKEGKLKKGTGEQDYSIKLGDDGSYTLDWFAPIALPLFAGAEFANAGGDDPAVTVLDVIGRAVNPVAEMSMLQGITQLLQNASGFTSQGAGETVVNVLTSLATNYFTQIVPTSFGQLARTIDPVQRSTKSTAKSASVRKLEQTGRSIVAKVPWASKLLEPKLDQWGNPVLNGKTKGGRIIQNFLSMGYWKDNNATPVDKEILRLGEALGDDEKNQVFPSALDGSTLKFNGKDVRLSAKDVTKYNKTVGKESYKAVEKLMSTSEYQKMSDSDKAKALADAYTDVKKYAKQETLISMGEDKFEVRTDGWSDKDKKAAKKYAKNHDIDDIVDANRTIESMGFKTTRGKETNIKALILADSGKANNDLYKYYGIGKHERNVINDYRAAGGTVQELKTTQRNLQRVAKRVGKSVSELPAGAKAVALALSGGTPRLYKLYDTSTPNSRFYWQKETNSARGLVATGEDIKDRQKVYNGSKNGDDPPTVESTKKYLDKRKDLTQKQKSWYFEQVTPWTTKQNPYGHYTAPKKKIKPTEQPAEDTTNSISKGILSEIKKNFPAAVKENPFSQPTGEPNYKSRYAKNEIKNLGKNLAKNKLEIGEKLYKAAKASKKGLTTPYNDEDYIPKRTLEVVRTGDPKLDEIARKALAKGGNKYLYEKMKNAPKVKSKKDDTDYGDTDYSSSSSGGGGGRSRRGRKGSGGSRGSSGGTTTTSPTALKTKVYDWTPIKVSSKAGWTDAQIRRVFNALIKQGLTEKQAVSRIAALWNTRFK